MTFLKSGNNKTLGTYLLLATLGYKAVCRLSNFVVNEPEFSIDFSDESLFNDLVDPVLYTIILGCFTKIVNHLLINHDSKA